MDSIKPTGKSFDSVVCVFLDAKNKIERKNYSEYWTSLDTLIDELYMLAGRIYDIIDVGSLLYLHNRDTTIEIMVNTAYDQIGNYDRDKCSAWNFFTTKMLNNLRQQYHNQKKHSVYVKFLEQQNRKVNQI